MGDFGLAEQLETKDYVRQDMEEAVKLPVKWLAPESLTDYVFSEKTDIVSSSIIEFLCECQLCSMQSEHYI